MDQRHEKSSVPWRIKKPAFLRCPFAISTNRKQKQQNVLTLKEVVLLHISPSLADN